MCPLSLYAFQRVFIEPLGQAGRTSGVPREYLHPWKTEVQAVDCSTSTRDALVDVMSDPPDLAHIRRLVFAETARKEGTPVG